MYYLLTEVKHVHYTNLEVLVLTHSTSIDWFLYDENSNYWWVKVVFAYLVSGAAAEAYCVRTKYGCCWDGSEAKVHVGTATDGCPSKHSSVNKPNNVQIHDIANCYIFFLYFLSVEYLHLTCYFILLLYKEK